MGYDLIMVVAHSLSISISDVVCSGVSKRLIELIGKDTEWYG